MDYLEHNIKAVREKLDEAAQGRPYTLLAATKTQPVEVINQLTCYGIFDFGENRVQEWVEKREKIDINLKYHHIGRLQRNKIKYIIKEIHMIHSVDQVTLALEINKRASEIGRRVNILLQVNTAGEEQKGGVAPEELPSLYDECMKMDALQVRGLMCMAPLTHDESVIRQTYQRAKELFDHFKQTNNQIDTLSMGMSQDACLALQEGSTLVRIGTSLFGSRQ